MSKKDGQNISANFYLDSSSLQPEQYVVWCNPDSDCENKFNLSSMKNSSFESGRYSLALINQTTWKLSIIFTEQNDAGKHTLSLHEHERLFCELFRFNLSI